MKTLTATVFTGLMLFTVSCKKESSTVQSSGITGESATQTLSNDINEPAARAVRIGKQVWMTKDLTTSYYRNGDKIPQVQDPFNWSRLTTGAWCWYDDNPAMGKLYNWYAVNDPRGLAPEGWHVPSVAEWATLITYLGGQAVAGGKMKETGTTHWLSPNYGATNSSGFTALPGGYLEGSFFYGIGYVGYWWSSTESSIPGTALYRSLNFAGVYVYGSASYKESGYSVRCLRD